MSAATVVNITRSFYCFIVFSLELIYWFVTDSRKAKIAIVGGFVFLEMMFLAFTGRVSFFTAMLIEAAVIWGIALAFAAACCVLDKEGRDGYLFSD